MKFILILILIIFLIFFININEYFENNNSSYKIAIITSIYGNYDNLKEHHINNKNKVDWYCFTDNNIQSDFWTIINTPYHINNMNNEHNEYNNYYNNINEDDIKNMMSAKYYKINISNLD